MSQPAGKRKKPMAIKEAPEPKEFLPYPEALMPFFMEEQIKEANDYDPNQTWKELTGNHAKIGDLVYVLFEGTRGKENQCFLGKVIYIGEERIRIHFVDASQASKNSERQNTIPRPRA
jgi:hypothetical protein